MKLFYLSLLGLLVLVSCTILGLDKEEEEEEPFQPVFTAEINGEPFEGTGFEQSAGAVMTKQGAYDWLIVFADMYDEQFFPYYESISFALTYEEGVKRYAAAPVPVVINEVDTKRTGGRYFESDGDVPISMYEALSDGDGFITVEMEQLEDGRTLVSGTFQMTVAKKYRDHKLTRRKTDTLHITNGEYRVLLDDRREDE